MSGLTIPTNVVSAYAEPETSTSAAFHIPSLVPWPGNFDFNISVPTDNKDRNRVCIFNVFAY